MTHPIVYCPGGKPSQSGTAAAARYQNINITDCGVISDVPGMLGTKDGPYIIPIWNSNQGEIEASQYIWDLVEEAKITIFDIWPKRIEFWFVVRTGDNNKYGVIGSVGVANTQCKEFIRKQNAELKTYKLTTVAFDDYKSGAHLDGVLVAPGQGEDDGGYKVVTKKTANVNNFTSFVKLVSSRSRREDVGEPSTYLTGVTMGSLSGTTLDDEQISLFDGIFSDVTDFKYIPKLIFVFKRTDKVGLLFEGEELSSGDFLSAELLEESEIVVHENAGELGLSYTEELDAMLANEFPVLKQDDFILHIGVSSFLFACPPLGMYTHGYEREAVEPVVRLYIDKVFEFIDNEAECSDAEKEFFNRYKSSWEEKRSEFIEFTVIGSSADVV